MSRKRSVNNKIKKKVAEVVQKKRDEHKRRNNTKTASLRD